MHTLIQLFIKFDHAMWDRYKAYRSDREKNLSGTLLLHCMHQPVKMHLWPLNPQLTSATLHIKLFLIYYVNLYVNWFLCIHVL